MWTTFLERVKAGHLLVVFLGTIGVGSWTVSQSYGEIQGHIDLQASYPERLNQLELAVQDIKDILQLQLCLDVTTRQGADWRQCLLATNPPVND